MRALVVGGTGPSGVPIIEGLLALDFDVTIYHRGAHEVEFSIPIEHIHGDPFSPDSIVRDLAHGNFDVAISTYGRLRHIADAMAGKTAKFIGVTSGASYLGYRNAAHTDNGLPNPVGESFPAYADRQIDPFGWAVAEGERQLLAQHDRGDFDATIFRYPNVYGPRGAGPAIRSIMRRILDKRRHILVPGNGDRLRNRGYVDNLAHVVLSAIDNPRASGQIYNVCDERTLTVRELITCVAEAMGHEWELVPVADPIVEVLGRGYVSEPHHQLFDLSKAKCELGYRDIVPAWSAVQQTVHWHLEHPPAEIVEVAGPNSGRRRDELFDYEGEDRLVALASDFTAKVSAAFPAESEDDR